MNGFPEYHRFDALGLAELVRQGQVSPMELCEEATRRIERINPKLNAVVNRMYDQGREAASKPLGDGAFEGVPFLLKDTFAGLAGVRMTSGSAFLRDFVPDHDGELVARY